MIISIQFQVPQTVHFTYICEHKQPSAKNKTNAETLAISYSNKPLFVTVTRQSVWYFQSSPMSRLLLGLGVIFMFPKNKYSAPAGILEIKTFKDVTI